MVRCLFIPCRLDSAPKPVQHARVLAGHAQIPCERSPHRRDWIFARSLSLVLSIISDKCRRRHREREIYSRKVAERFTCLVTSLLEIVVHKP